MKNLKMKYELKKVIKNWTEHDIVFAWNQCCSEEDTIYFMENFSEDFHDMTAWEVAEMLQGKEDFNVYDDYYIWNRGIYLKSLNNIMDYICIFDIIDYIIENKETFGDENIEMILQEEQDNL